MRLSRSVVVLAIAAAILALPATTPAQSIDPATFSGTMAVGETITIHKTITLGEFGANLVDLFFLADNTGSMGGIIANAKSGASDILGNVPAGADYNFGVGSYQGDCSESGEPAGCSFYYLGYTEHQALTSSAAAAQAGINTWAAGYGGDYPEANFDALRMVSETAGWRTGSQRLIVWFGDAPSHTESTTEAGAIAALNAVGAKVIAFNSVGAGSGMDGCYLTECDQASDIAAATGGSLTNNFNTLSPADFITAVNAEITAATSVLDLVFGTSYAGTGLSFSFVCTDALGCDDVLGGESRTFDVMITALEEGTYDFSIFAAGVSAEELDHIVVGSVVPEPTTWVMLATGLLGLGIVAWRRKEEDFA
jgi:hypothetical protein